MTSRKKVAIILATIAVLVFVVIPIAINALSETGGGGGGTIIEPTTTEP
jgi:hypothetical protein